MTKMPVMLPRLPGYEKVAGYLAEMDSARVYANDGALVKRLEARVAKHLNVTSSCVVATTSATVAIQGAATISPEPVFNLPSFSFPAPAHGVANAGKRYRFVDSAEDTMDISVHATGIEDGGVVDVRPFGAPVRVVENWTTREVIADAAASLGRTDLDLKSLPPSWVVVFSLHATKPISAGEGGVAVFGDDARADEFRKWISFGFSGSRVSHSLGTNGKMSEMSAAYALASLDAFPANVESSALRQFAQRTLEERHGLWGISGVSPGAAPYWIVRFDSAAVAARFSDHLDAAGIESRFWWGSPCHRMEAFSQALPARQAPVTADFLAVTVLGLPNFPEMSRRDFKVLDRAISEFES